MAAGNSRSRSRLRRGARSHPRRALRPTEPRSPPVGALSCLLKEEGPEHRAAVERSPSLLDNADLWCLQRNGKAVRRYLGRDKCGDDHGFDVATVSGQVIAASLHEGFALLVNLLLAAMVEDLQGSRLHRDQDNAGMLVPATATARLKAVAGNHDVGAPYTSPQRHTIVAGNEFANCSSGQGAASNRRGRRESAANKYDQDRSEPDQHEASS